MDVVDVVVGNVADCSVCLSFDMQFTFKSVSPSETFPREYHFGKELYECGLCPYEIVIHGLDNMHKYTNGS